MRLGNKTMLAAAMAATALVCTACSGASSDASKPSPSVTHLTADQVLQPLMQCFIDHHLIPESVLEAGKDGNPPSDVSTWTKDGTVVTNLRFGDWFSENSAVVVEGKSIYDWMTAIEASRGNWPESTCGSMPAAK